MRVSKLFYVLCVSLYYNIVVIGFLFLGLTHFYQAVLVVRRPVKLERFTKKAKLPAGFWDSRENRLAYLDFLKSQLGITSNEGLYTVTSSQINQTGGRQFLLKYGGSFASAVADLIPEHKWYPWKFKQSPRNWWAGLGMRFAARTPDAIAIVREYLRELEKKHKINNLSDWYQIVKSPKTKLGTTAATHLAFLGTLPSILQTVYPNHEWKFNQPQSVTKFKDGASADFSLQTTRREYMDFLKDQLGGTLESLYQVTSQLMIQTGGAKLLQYMDNSPAHAVISAYPEHNWKRWKFIQSPKGWWADLAERFLMGDTAAVSTVREFIDDIGNRLGIEQLEDWYRVSNEQLGSTTLLHLKYLGKLPHVLWKLYPHHQWDFAKFKLADKRSAQRLVMRTLQKGFPHERILEEASPEELGFTDVLPHETSVRFDIAIKSLKLIVEYHGGHHYLDTYIVGGVKLYRARDASKRQLCERNGFTLVEIPYWWDNTLDSLMNTIRVVRPDLVPNQWGNGAIIPPEPKKRYAFEGPRAELASMFMGFSKEKESV